VDEPRAGGLLHQFLSFLGVAPAQNFRIHRAPGDSTGRASLGYSQRVAKENPTAMKPMPTIRLYCPRSSKSGTFEMSLLKT
jgi:hypothetical protein